MTLQSGNVLVWPAGLNSLRSLGLLKDSTYVNANRSCQITEGKVTVLQQAKYQLLMDLVQRSSQQSKVSTDENCPPVSCPAGSSSPACVSITSQKLCQEGEMAEAPAAHPVSPAIAGRKICKAENSTDVLPQKQHRPLCGKLVPQSYASKLLP